MSRRCCHRRLKEGEHCIGEDPGNTKEQEDIKAFQKYNDGQADDGGWKFRTIFYFFIKAVNKNKSFIKAMVFTVFNLSFIIIMKKIL